MATVATKPAEITAVAQACGRARRTVRLGGPGVVILPFSINASHQESRVAEEEPMGSARRLASRRAGPWAPLAGSLRAGQATKDLSSFSSYARSYGSFAGSG